MLTTFLDVLLGLDLSLPGCNFLLDLADEPVFELGLLHRLNFIALCWLLHLGVQEDVALTIKK